MFTFHLQDEDQVSDVRMEDEDDEFDEQQLLRYNSGRGFGSIRNSLKGIDFADTASGSEQCSALKDLHEALMVMSLCNTVVSYVSYNL